MRRQSNENNVQVFLMDLGQSHVNGLTRIMKRVVKAGVETIKIKQNTGEKKATCKTS